MKKLTGILLTFILCFSILMNAVADDNASPYKITINGINVVFTDGKTVLEPVENDGVLYVPLEAFLKTLNLDYNVEGKEFIISTATAEETPTPTPKPTYTPKPQTAYEQLSRDEKKFVDALLNCSKIFYNPGSITINKVWNAIMSSGSDNCYYIMVTCQEADGRFRDALYLIAGDWGDGAEEYKINTDVTETRFDYTKINNAYNEKIKTLGY